MTPSPKRKSGFVLPVLNLKNSQRGGRHAAVQGAGLTAESAARVLANTPSLKKLYEFLGRKP